MGAFITPSVSCYSLVPFNALHQHDVTAQKIGGARRQYHRKKSVKVLACQLPQFSRRDILRILVAASITPTLLPESSEAVNGLHIFPLREPLTNTYYLMRACETKSDAAKITAVNPVDKLSIEKLGLTRAGVDNAILAARALSNAGITEDSWIWPSVTISAFETAEIIASQLRVRRDRIVPEFSFLDARGVGSLEGKPVSVVQNILVEHDKEDSSWRPEPGEDGTPNDSAEDVFVRVRQLISKLETQYFGQDILIVSPDSDILSIWQAAVSGFPLRQHMTFGYSSGEVRRVKELVTDAYGKVIEEPAVETIFKPA